MNVIFWHICGLTNFKQVALDQYEAIKSSGLLEKVQKVYITYLGDSKSDLDFLLEKSDKLVLHVYDSYIRHYERLCLHALHDFAQTNNGNVLYIHAKGVSDRFDSDPVLKSNIVEWRKMMEYFLIHQHESCLELLKTHDALGCCVYDKPSGNLLHIQDETHYLHFSGNFWWSTCEYVRTLPRIREDIVGNLEANCNFHLCERWILSKAPSCKYLELYAQKTHSCPSHFYSDPPDIIYKDVDLKKVFNL